MMITVPAIGFLISSVIHDSCRSQLKLSTQIRGVYKALNAFVVRLSLLLSINPEECDKETLNKLFINMCCADDILLIFKQEENSGVRSIIEHIKNALHDENPYQYFISKVYLSENKTFIHFDL